MAADILGKIGLSDLIVNFIEEKLDDITVISSLNDFELQRLGLVTIGDRVRFREECRKATAASAPPAIPEARAQVLSLFRPSRSRLPTSDSNRRRGKSRTWTGNFMCLADKNTTSSPNSAQKTVLQRAGLGSKKITLPVGSKEEEVRAKLHEEYEKLKTGGGFELLKCSSNCRSLELVKGRYDTDNLRLIFGNQCKVYVRPIQTNLSTCSSTALQRSMIEENCQSCGVSFPITDLRDHVRLCSEPGELQQVQDEHLEMEWLPTPTSTLTSETDNSTSASVINDNHIVITEDPIVESAATETSQTDVLTDVINGIIDHCKEKNIDDPLAILKIMQEKIVTGRDLEIRDETELVEGETNFIIVSRENLVQEGLEEIANITNPRVTLEVQFAGEEAVDLGGPRKEFFRLMLQQLEEKYFQPVKEWSTEYETIGKILGLSLLQNGNLPRVLDADSVQELFFSEKPRPFIEDLRKGLNWLGIHKLVQGLPLLIHLFTPGPVRPLTLKMLTHLLKAKFSEPGSNRRMEENRVYRRFIKYLREVASGRRGSVTLEKVLMFTTGTDVEPPLGFQLNPSIQFLDNSSPYPTANTCVNNLVLSVSENVCSMREKDLFGAFDLAFSNTFYGLK